MKITLVALSFIMMTSLFAQTSNYQMEPNKSYTEIDFLSSYYNQDGNNAAVTGGVGTEKLTDIASMIVVNMPIDSARSIKATFGADYYTSASTDNIDQNPSSASSRDIRVYTNIGYEQKKLDKGKTYGARLGFSAEYDYVSVSGGLDYAKEFNEGNTEFNVSGQAFFDSWDIIYPVELRSSASLPSNKRNSFNLSTAISQVINKRLQMAISAEAIYMTGLLSTPFHRVYLADEIIPTIERLPDNRLKLPISIRLNYFPFDQLVVRTYYRYYTDDFGIVGHTASIELPIKISNTLSISPFLRYHEQSQSDYFAPFKGHLSSQDFYTSDYDLSQLSSTKIGLGFSYSPTYGLSRIKVPLTKKVFVINKLNLRFSQYQRNTGLDAFAFALGLSCRL